MKLKLLQYIKKIGPPCFISPNPYLFVVNKPRDKVNSLKVDINTHPEETDNNNVSLYVPIFKTGSAKSMLEFLMLLKYTQGSEPQYRATEICN